MLSDLFRLQQMRKNNYIWFFLILTKNIKKSNQLYRIHNHIWQEQN